jgi:glycerol uptake facilitator-like aquaporin
MPSLARRLSAEALGTLFLLMTIIGSGIMGERLAGGNVAIALLANSLATGGALVVLILVFGPISGAHFNPAVTLAMMSQRDIRANEALLYVLVQVVAAFAGVAAAHFMFGEPVFSASIKVRTGPAQWASEFIATFGLLTIIWGCVRYHRLAITAVAVSAYIVSAYWFTSSTSFANPAVTLARAASNTFAGIRPDDIAGFLVAQLAGAMAATLLFQWLSAPAPLDKRR